MRMADGWPGVDWIANKSAVDKTGIPIENLPAKALVEVYINENDASEHYAIPSNTLL
jgi:hypothetical protein